MNLFNLAMENETTMFLMGIFCLVIGVCLESLMVTYGITKNMLSGLILGGAGGALLTFGTTMITFSFYERKKRCDDMSKWRIWSALTLCIVCGLLLFATYISRADITTLKYNVTYPIIHIFIFISVVVANAFIFQIQNYNPYTIKTE